MLRRLVPAALSVSLGCLLVGCTGGIGHPQNGTGNAGNGGPGPSDPGIIDVTGTGGRLSLPQPTTPFGLDISARHWLYYEAWVTGGILLVAAWLLVRGRVGRAWRAIRDGEIAAVSSGVGPATYKTLAFGVSSAYAGAAGALYAIQVSYVSPSTFPITLSILLLASVVAGGLASLSGVIFGALLIEYLPIYAQNISKQAPSVAFGAVLIICMFVLPGGIAGLGRRLVGPFKRALRG